MQAPSRRRFVKSAGLALTGAFIAAHWTQVCEAAEHAHDVAAKPGGKLRFLSDSEAAEVSAIASCIIPSGATPGAREANATFFIDAALGTFMARLAPEWRKGLAAFNAAFARAAPGAASFSKAPEDRQIAFVRTVDTTPFFNTMRTLTVLGTVTLPRYGGNQGKVGWKMMGFEDRHVFVPPFGDYDREYKGFEPYTGAVKT
jgi:gluconate 2-dehydrogenase gamma chain